MNLRQSLYLLVLLFLLVGLYLGMQYRREHQAHVARVASQVFTFSPEDIQRLSIKRLAETKSTAERVSDSEWRIVDPHPSIPPFHRMWRRVSEHLAGLVNEHTVLEHPADLGAYGLDPPSLELWGETNDGAALHLAIGDLEPTQRHRYARLNDGPLFLVNTDAFFELNRSLHDLRHRYLVQDRESPLLRIEFAWIWTDPPRDDGDKTIETGDESVAVIIERASKDTPWRIVKPVDRLAKHETVQALADDLQFSVGKAFIDSPENLSDYGLQPARARLSFADAAGNPERTIWLGSVDDSPDQPGLFVQVDGQEAVMVLDGHLLTLLPTSPDEWRDLRLLTGRLSDIKELTYTSEQDAFVLKKDAEFGWNLAEPAMEAVNVFAVNGFLRFIKEVEGDEYVDEEAALPYFDDPEITISLRFDDDTTGAILLTPAPDDPDTYYARQDSGGIVSLTGIAVNMLSVDSETFRSRELLRVMKPEVRQMDVDFEGAAYTIARRHDQWVGTAPEGFAINNQADVDMLLNAVSPLNALGSAEKDTGVPLTDYGLDAPVFSIKIYLSEHSDPLSLDIGSVNPDNASERFARSSIRDGVFRISQEVMDEVREALRGFQ